MTSSRCSVCSLPVSRGEGLSHTECLDALDHIQEEETTMGKTTAKKSTTPRRVHRDGQAPVTVEAPVEPSEGAQDAARPTNLLEATEAEEGDVVVGGSDPEPAPQEEAVGGCDPEPAPTSETKPAGSAPAAQAARAPRRQVNTMSLAEQRRVILWVFGSTLRTIEEVNWDLFGVSGMKAVHATLTHARQKIEAARPARKGSIQEGTARISAKDVADFKDVLDDGDLTGIKVLAIAKGSARCQLKSGGKAVLPVRILEAE